MIDNHERLTTLEIRHDRLMDEPMETVPRSLSTLASRVYRKAGWQCAGNSTEWGVNVYEHDQEK